MSNWTYIKGIIEVSPMGRTQAEKRYILETVLEHLPVVEGSEGCMKIYINEKDGCSSSSSCDEFGERTNNLKDHYGERTRRNGWLHTKEEYILTLDGSLRDRYFNEKSNSVLKDFFKWLMRLAKRVPIYDGLIRINDYYDKKTIDCNDMIEYFEDPSWSNKENEPTWCEYLMWDRMKDSMYPLMLGYKYYNNKENDKEAERRIKYFKEK